MHIPDGFLTPKVAIATGVLSAIALGTSLRSARKLPPKKIPLLGLSAAFIFAAQMINFPVAAGTSGHLIGGALTAVLLGPSAAIIVLTCVLSVQCFVFADGGITALGANIFNMAVVDAFTGYAIYCVMRRLIPTIRGRFAAIAFASWAATVVAAIVCAGELSLSGMVPWNKAFPAMTLVHMLIGVGEALLTTLIIFAIWQTRPELLEANAESSPRSNFVLFSVLLSLGLAAFVAPFACGWPDGLDHVAAMLGVKEAARPVAAPMADYRLPGIAGGTLATMLAGIVGTIIVFGLAWLLAKILISDARQDAK